ncbi:hypothetical protein LOTGIDRAFT_155085 [Lottia gigantea]|uniref:Uncharacterized protein n=1 Tax=Lottia gigantea TaxID=225164 RepID=V3Z4I8_LOTGI|nr:hypothetical protein LOTGIDRAFT_155085 [Lottia gigantea]ESO85598.1 hypothetical protein LOTGIDRAFT_155085 [Lottia gigantea]
MSNKEQLFVITSNNSDIKLSLDYEYELDRNKQYELGLKRFSVYNSIRNINKNNNQLKISTDNGVTFKANTYYDDYLSEYAGSVSGKNNFEFEVTKVPLPDYQHSESLVSKFNLKIEILGNPQKSNILKAHYHCQNCMNCLQISVSRKILNPLRSICIGTYLTSKPKKDRCDRCEEFRNINNPDTEASEKYNNHFQSKVETKEERARDTDTTAVVCFDLENVLALPRANVSSFFYKRKLSVYNLTAHCSLDKRGYCAIWSEGLSGRAGNDIASSLVKLLECVVNRHPNVTDIIQWSDSCVAQNRNSLMCVALKEFIRAHPSIKSTTQKFCEPGHSSIQEVDAVHSQIERTLSKCEVYSPVSLMRILPSVNRKKLIVLQMKANDFFDYQAVSKVYRFAEIPFTKVKQLCFQSDRHIHVLYKTKHASEFTEVRLLTCHPDRNAGSKVVLPIILPQVKVIPLSEASLLSADKINDLKSMLKFMPDVDKQYVKSVCKL